MKYCPKCKKEFTDNDSFCDKCGGKLKEKEEKKEHKPKETRKEVNVTRKAPKLTKKKGIIIGVLVMIAIFIFAVPLPHSVTIEYTERVPYSDTETYYEEVPYQGTDCEWVTPKYNDESNMEWVEGKIKVICTISNFENGAVEFEYKLYTNDCEGNDVDSYGSRFVTIGAGQTIKKEALLDSGGCYGCWAHPKKIEECHLTTKFKQVEKQRTVTKYKDEARTRKGTGYATLFQQWTGQAQWYYKV